MAIRLKSRDIQEVDFGIRQAHENEKDRNAIGSGLFDFEILRRLGRLRMMMLVASSINIVLLPMQRRV
jgi:hypothetical protein